MSDRTLSFAEVEYDFCRYRFAEGGTRPGVAGFYAFTNSSLSGESDAGGAPDIVIDQNAEVTNTARPNGVVSPMLRLYGTGLAHADFTHDFSGGFAVAFLLVRQNEQYASAWRFRVSLDGLFNLEIQDRTATLAGETFHFPNGSFILTINGDSDMLRFYADRDLIGTARSPAYGFQTTTRLEFEYTPTDPSFHPFTAVDSIAVATRVLGTHDREQMISVYDVVGQCNAPAGEPCYNTRATCQSPDDYNPEPKVLRFVDPTSYAPVDIDAIPSIRSIGTTPARIRPGEDLGERASISVGFADHPYHDRGLDPYVDQRDYDPMTQGTYWAKFRSRFPYYRTRALRLIQGTLGQPLREMESRHYVMDSIDGPAADGRFSITAKDVLKLADDERAQAPRASKGALSADITATATSATLTPAGIGDSDYPASGRCVIGNEVCEFTRSGDTLTLTRGLSGTAAEEHSEGDTVQIALVFDSAQASAIIHELLTEYATVPARFIDLPAWTDEDTTYIGRLYGAEITEPTAVRELVGQLCEQVGLSIWWDEIEQRVRLKAIRQPDTSPGVVDDERHFLSGSLDVKEQPKKRVSQVWVYYGVLDPTEDVDEPRNYRSVYVRADADAEAAEQYGQQQIRKVFARWISRFNQPAAADMSSRILSRYRDAPRQLKFALKWDSQLVTLGNAYDASTRLIQAPDGSIPRTRILVTSYERSTERVNIESEEFLYIPPDDIGIKRVVVDADSLNVNARAAYDDIYPTIQSGDDVEIIIENGVILGSDSTNRNALDIGTWPTGVNITLIVKGRIQGAGGNGGQGTGTGPADSGKPGGQALYTRYAITLEAENGEIWSGAGGGGGGRADEMTNSVGGGGGGGAGYIPGNTGSGGSGSPEPATTESGGDGRNSVNTNYQDGRGGAGGDPGENGQPGQNGGGAGGLAGNAIDGASYITVTTSGDIRGAQIN